MRRLSRYASSDDHADFGDNEVATVAIWLVDSFTTKPPTAHDAILVSQGVEPERMTRAELVAWLASNGLGSVARRVERFAVPRGHAIAVVVGDEGVRVVSIDVSDLGSATDETAPRGASALAVLGSLTGGSK